MPCGCHLRPLGPQLVAPNPPTLCRCIRSCPPHVPSLQVLYVQAFVLVFLLGKFMGKVFFGQLRAAEMEVSGGWGRGPSRLGTGTLAGGHSLQGGERPGVLGGIQNPNLSVPFFGVGLCHLGGFCAILGRVVSFWGGF